MSFRWNETIRVVLHLVGRAVAALSLIAATQDVFAGESAKRPNIVLIMADDLGFSDLGCYGSEIATPNLDRLAAGGMRFTQFYNTGRCCPTRASLLTGLYPHQAGVGHMESDFGVPGYRGYLNDRCVTIAEVLRAAGYRTLMTGKWNVGPRRPHWPVDRGFDHYFGLLRGASNYFDPKIGPRRNASEFAMDAESVTTFAPDFYATDAFTNYAVRWLGEQNAERPFFLYVAYTAPHSPLHARPEEITKYRGKYLEGWEVIRKRRHQRMVEAGIIDSRWPLSPQDSQVPAWSELPDQDARGLKMAVYAAQIDRMDQGIGKILAKIKQLSVEQNTLVLFLSDNGADADEEQGSTTRDIPPGPKESSHIYGRTWANVSNTPLRGYKHQAHEGGISTPLVAYWPDVIQPGAISHQPGHAIDIMATCTDIAGAAYPRTIRDREILSLEGKSLAPIFRTGRREGHDAIYWEHEGNRAVRQGKWKLVALHSEPWELYDLDADRTELNNLAAKFPDKVQELAAKYAAWAERCGVVPWAEIQAANRANKSKK